LSHLHLWEGIGQFERNGIKYHYHIQVEVATNADLSDVKPEPWVMWAMIKDGLEKVA
jgi:hypothetical protein